MRALAHQGELYDFKPFKDKGGKVVIMLDEYQWREFMCGAPELFTHWVVARMNDETSSTSEGS